MKYKDTDEMKIYFIPPDNDGNCSYFSSVMLDAPLMNVCAILAEAQLWKEWVPLVNTSSLIH